MRFRPCIDIHDGRVKQIIGGSLKDTDIGGLSSGSEDIHANDTDTEISGDGGSHAVENYVSEKDAAFYSGMYRDLGLSGGHVIILNAASSEYYGASKAQALSALSAYPGGMMAGGGITPDNAGEFIEAGASHVIVTSYVFHEGRIDYDRLGRMRDTVGRERLCLDLSCRRRGSDYIIVTDRWQRFTDERLDAGLLMSLADYAGEYLVHAVDVEGRQQGIEEAVVPILKESPIPLTYAGGVRGLDDIEKLKKLGDGKIDVTVGSALKIFGGSMEIEEIIECIS